ncbi:Glycosyltransferase BC10 [Sesamum alatum]|uniref:Glycosyltransferase BC10 n=1 Tax=Sesamum alatum TaxID=300844 RepID=A0AAE1XPV2_9LAMI|nr:Glycosyltransferase BC10 [Sesamum alatum]
MLPPTPLSLFCALLLCLPLAVIFTFTDSSAASSGGATTSPPLPTTTTTTTSSINLTKTNLQPPLLLPPTIIKPQIKNQTTADTTLSQLALDEEEDKDDESLFRLASRVDPTPKPVKKLAFMFLTTSPLPFAPLWELFFARAPKNLYNIYVHADPSANYTTTKGFRGVFSRRVIPSKPTRRHTPTLIAAARRLLAHALLHDESNSMFALLSPSCIPLHSFSYTYRNLIKSRRSFIEILKDEPGAYERWAARGEEAMLPEVEYEDFRIGSQFWVLKRKHARIVVGERRVWSKFKLPCLRDYTCYPEEHYFPTVLSMVDPRGCIPCTLTHVDWNGGHGGHPRMYMGSEVGPELIRRLRESRPRYGDEISISSNSSAGGRHDPFMFARKFSPGAVHQLMSIANEVIFKD